MKVIITGGVASGAACAARLRRLDENAEIILLEKGRYISYANCGLPYYLSGTVSSRDSLFVQTPEGMRAKFNIDVRTENEVTSIDRTAGKVTVTDHSSGRTYEESYDKLVLATGSSPLKPDIPGIGSDKIHTLWSVPDMDRLYDAVSHSHSAAVIGGGFVGLEVMENLKEAGLEVTLIEGLDQVMAPVDHEMAALLHEHIRSKGINLILSDSVTSFSENAEGIDIHLKSGKTVSADFAVLSIGVRPSANLAREAGLECNQKGFVCTNENMLTSDPDIYAAGDITETEDIILGDKTALPLAGPASKQGRIIADNIAGITSSYAGSQGSSIVRVFDLTAASTGLNEKKLIENKLSKGRDYRTSIITQNSHVGFYPGAMPTTIKLIYKADGSGIYGAQIIGGDGVDKRIDVIASAIRMGGDVRSLMNLELAYAPPFSSAKDPVNMAGFVADNELRGLVHFSEPDLSGSDALLLDIREDAELMAYEIPNAVHIPLGQLRDRLSELDRSRKIIIFCAIGARSYNAARILMQNGFKDVSVYPGGTNVYRAINGAGVPAAARSVSAPDESGVSPSPADVSTLKLELDCCGMQCPGPLMKMNDTIQASADGDVISVTASDSGFLRDISAWCSKTGNSLLSTDDQKGRYTAVIRKGSANLPGSDIGDIQITENKEGDGKTIIVFSGDFDKVMAAFIIANGAAAMGSKVTMFFTFWGLTALRKQKKQKVKKSLIESMFGSMLPRGFSKLGLSRMNMAGIGTAMMKKVMNDKNVSSLEDLVKKAMDQGVTIMACTMSMDVMGIKQEELIDGVEMAGVGTYLGNADNSNVNLFV